MMLVVRKGQGLMEVIISFAVIGFGLGGALALLISTGASNKQTADRTVAMNLSREGIEVVRSIRDSNAARQLPFYQTLYTATADITAVAGFTPQAGWVINFTAVDINDPLAVMRSTSTDADIQADLMVQNTLTGTSTPYKRILVITPICDTGGGAFSYPATGGTCGANILAGLRVQSQVRWTSRGRTFNVSSAEDLFDWQP